MWFIFYFSVLFSYAYALTDEEVKMQFTKMVLECTKQHPVEIGELTKLRTYKIPTDKDTKCLLACAYRKEGSMNDKGMYDLTHALKKAELTANGDAKRLENGKKLAEFCSKVNDEKVSDGENGCERAGLMFKCLIENIPKALTDEEVKMQFTKMVLECTKQHPVEIGELTKLRTYKIPTDKHLHKLKHT